MGGSSTLNRGRAAKVEGGCADERLFGAFLLLRDGLCTEEVKKQTGLSKSFIDTYIVPLVRSKEQKSDGELRELLKARRDRYVKYNRVHSLMRYGRRETEENVRVLRSLQSMLQFRDDVLSEACNVRDGKICTKGGYSRSYQELALGAACVLKAVDNLRIRKKGDGDALSPELITPLQACKCINVEPYYFAKVLRRVDGGLMARNAIAYVSKDIEMACEELGRCREIDPMEERLALGKTVEKEAKELLLTRYVEGPKDNGAEIREMQILTGSVVAMVVISAYKRHREDNLVIEPLGSALKISMSILNHANHCAANNSLL